MNSEQRPLTSWKEIASYLGKGVRTVQRWERERGLPVRRPCESDKHVVIALPAELQEWLRGPMKQRNEHSTTTRVRPSPADERIVSAIQKVRETTCEVRRRSEDLYRISAQLCARSEQLARRRKTAVEDTPSGGSPTLLRAE